MKGFVAKDDDQVLGFSMIGPEAGEVVATIQMAMLAKLPFTVVRDAVISHPTMAEGLGPFFPGSALSRCERDPRAAGALDQFR